MSLVTSPTALDRRPAAGLILVMFLLAGALGGCVTAESWEATRLLQDIDAAGGASRLKETVPEPRRSTLRYEIQGRDGLADLYMPGEAPGAMLVLVPGFTEAGRNDARLVELARSLARARFAVLVPEVPGSRQLRVRLEDRQTIADAVRFAREQRPALAARGVGLVAISYAVGLAVLGSLDLEAATRPDFLVGLGGYYDTTAVVTFATTGRYRPPGERRWRRGHPLDSAKWIFLAGNAAVLDDPRDRQRLQEVGRDCFAPCAPDVAALRDELGPEGDALLDLITNDDPAQVPALIAALPPEVTRRLQALSLKHRDLSPLQGRLILIHGRRDPLVPFTESQALAQAVPGSELFIIDDFSHITPRGVGWAGQLQLVNAIQAVLERRSLPP